MSYVHTQDMDEDTEVVVTGLSLDQTTVAVIKLSLAQMETPNQQSSVSGACLIDITEDNAHMMNVHM